MPVSKKGKATKRVVITVQDVIVEVAAKGPHHSSSSFHTKAHSFIKRLYGQFIQQIMLPNPPREQSKGVHTTGKLKPMVISPNRQTEEDIKYFIARNKARDAERAFRQSVYQAMPDNLWNRAGNTFKYFSGRRSMVAA